MTATAIPVVRLCVLAGAALLPATPAWGADPPLSMRTYTFKTAGDLKIQADVYRADDAAARPAAHAANRRWSSAPCGAAQVTGTSP